MKKMFDMKRLTLIAVVFMMIFVAFSSIDFINSAKATPTVCLSWCCPAGTTCVEGEEQVSLEYSIDDDDDTPPPNNPPVAVADSASVGQDSSLNRVYVLINDSDPDGDPLTIFSVPAVSSHGEVENKGLYVEYTPDPGYVGSDSFAYTISDGNGGTDSSTVTMTVNTVNHPPEANNDFPNVQENSVANQIDVLINDNDPDGDEINIDNSIAIPPIHGSAVVVGNLIEYTPIPGYFGGDSFAYTISDGNSGTDSATVTVSITSIAPGDEEPPDSADTECYRVLLEVPSQPSAQNGLQGCYVGVDYDFESQLGASYGGNALIKFKFNWGDGNESPTWIGPRAPDTPESDTHQWGYAGIYDVRVKALVDPSPDGDPSDQVETDWSKPLPVIVRHKSEVPSDS